MPSGTFLRPVLALCFVASALPVFAQTVREKVSVEVITIRLTARDASGKRVEDLAPSDLILTVDGKPVAIDTLSAPDPVARSAVRPQGNANPPSAPAASPRPAPERPVQTLIFIDSGTHAFDLRDVCDELERFVRSSGSTNHQFLVGRFDGEGMRTASSWTRDVAAVAAQIHEIGHASRHERLQSANSLPPPSPTNPLDETLMRVQLHRENICEALLEALATFPEEPADRRLLLVSGGAALARQEDVVTNLRASSEQKGSNESDRARGPAGNLEAQRTTFALWSRATNPSGEGLTVSDVVAKALERDVALIPVQAEAFDRGSFDLEARGVPGVGSPLPSSHLSAGQTMTGLAEDTGGEPILVLKKAAARLTEIGDRAAYTLTFRDPAGDHRKHKVEVTCKRPGVRIDYRRGFRIPMDDERALDTVVARFRRPEMGTDPMSAVLVQSPAQGKAGRAATRLDIRYAPPLETGALGEREITIIAVGEDDQGKRTEPIQWSGTADRVEGAETFEAAMMMGGVAPGAYTWSVALRDEPTGLTSFVVVPPKQKQ